MSGILIQTLMTQQTQPDDKFLLDADVIRHFIKGNKLEILCALYKDKLYVPDIVENEICRSPHLQPHFNKLIQLGVKRITFPEDEKEITTEYAWLKSKEFKGDGESACMAMARYKNYTLLSSNFKDIKEYCDRNKINYKSTMDILIDAIAKGVMTEQECDLFISDVIKKNSKLPSKTIKEYRDKFFKK
jgi:predicted nucleic acid-binding protein